MRTKVFMDANELSCMSSNNLFTHKCTLASVHYTSEDIFLLISSVPKPSQHYDSLLLKMSTKRSLSEKIVAIQKKNGNNFCADCGKQGIKFDEIIQLYF